MLTGLRQDGVVRMEGQLGSRVPPVHYHCALQSCALERLGLR